MPLLKIFLISTTWTLVTGLLPWVSLHFDNISTLPWMLLLSRFAFIFAITLPFDYRDRAIDLSEGTLTIPGWLGWHKSRIIAFVLLGLCHGFELMSFLSKGYISNLTIAFCMTYLLAIALIGFVNPARNARYYAFGIDGLMIAPFMFYWILLKIG